MEPTDQLAVIIPALTALVDRLEPADLDRPTPCSAFDVRGVLEHMMGGATSFVPAFRGEPAAAGGPPPSDDPDGVPAAAFRHAMTSLLDAVNSPGALERTITAPFGYVPGSVFARYVAFDGLVHGYDIASSTGQAYDPPAEVVAAVDAFARETIGPDMRIGDTFAPATVVPDGATPLQALVAFSGRTL